MGRDGILGAGRTKGLALVRVEGGLSGLLSEETRKDQRSCADENEENENLERDCVYL